MTGNETVRKAFRRAAPLVAVLAALALVATPPQAAPGSGTHAWEAIAVTPHRHGRSGAKKPSTPVTIVSAGKPKTK